MISRNEINEFDTNTNEVGAGLSLPYLGLFSQKNDILGFRLGLEEGFNYFYFNNVKVLYKEYIRCRLNIWTFTKKKIRLRFSNITYSRKKGVKKTKLIQLTFTILIRIFDKQHCKGNYRN